MGNPVYQKFGLFSDQAGCALAEVNTVYKGQFV